MSNVVHAFAGCNPPAAADPDQARRGMERWRAAIDGVADPSLRRAADLLRADATASRLLSAVFGNSSFLTLMAELEPAFLVTVLRHGPEAALREVMAVLDAAHERGRNGATPASALRKAKRRLALATASADIAGALDARAGNGRAVGLRRGGARHSAGVSSVGGGWARRHRAIRRRGRRLAIGTDRPRHGQVGGPRTELLQRHRSHRPLRPRALPDAQRRRPGARGDPADARAGAADRRPHLRRLRLPHRSAPAPRSRRHADRRLGRWRRRSTTRRWARTGSGRR